MLEAKKDEIDLLQSIFTSEELSFSEPMVIKELALYSSHGLISDDYDIDLSLKINIGEPAVEISLAINLPINYPKSGVNASILLRINQTNDEINYKKVSAAFHSWLEEQRDTEEPVICAAVDWLRSFIPNHIQDDSGAVIPTQLLDTVKEEELICYWILSHHIRNPKKRKVIVDWARELNLSGCCLPGRPGIVVIEGDSDKCEIYWKRVRVLTWKRIQIKDREVLPLNTGRRFSNGFHEVGGSLSEKIRYMTQHGVSRERISLLLGFKAD